MKQFLLFCTIISFLSGWAAAPTLPATNLQFTNLEGNSFYLSCTKGNGANRLIVIKAGEPIVGRPVNGTNYLASTTFKSGSQLGTGEYVVSNSNAVAITVSGLAPNTIYYVAVFEYNGSGATSEYLTSDFLSGSGATASAPTQQPTNISFTNILGSSANISWTNGSGSGRLVLIKKGAPVDANPTDLVSYWAHTSATGGTQIGSGNHVLFKGNTNSSSMSGLVANTTYHFAVFEYNGSSASVFQTASPLRGSFTTLPKPTIQAKDAYTSLPDGNNLFLNWTAGNGTYHIVVAKEGAPVTSAPVDGTVYTSNTDFGLGSAVTPGEFVVYAGMSTGLRINKLKAGTTYHFAVFEYEQSATGPMYLTSSPATASGTTLSAPTIPAKDIIFSEITNGTMKLTWTNGNGTLRYVVAKKGATITAKPANFTTYYVHTAFGSGTNIGDLTHGVFYGAGNTVTVSNLEPNTTYYFTIYESNGSSPVYLTTDAPVASATTASRPSKAASGIAFSQVEGTTMRVDWTNGNGANRIVIAKKGSAVMSKPVDGVSYTANNSFGSGSELASGEYVLYNGTNTMFYPTNFEPGATYHFAIFEYAGTGAAIEYLTTSFPVNNVTMKAAPAIAAKDLTFSQVLNNSVKLSWTNGDGASRLVIAKAGSAVDAWPQTTRAYSAGSGGFSSGTQLGTGNYVVYNGNSNTATVSGLQPGITYHFAIVEFNGSSSPIYLTTSVLTGSQATAGRPSTAASNMDVVNIEPISVQVKWVNGNGSRRIVVASEGSTVTATPTDNTTYTANATFGNGQALVAGQFVVYDGTGNFVDVTGLTPGKTYHFTVFEYDQSSGNTFYLTAGAPAKSTSTLVAPTIQTSNVMFSSVGNTSATISWTDGNGAKRLVLVRAGQPVSVTPAQYNKYTTNTIFGTASAAINGDHFAVYSASGSSVTITGLQSGTTYHVAVFEYNGTNAPIYLAGLTAIGNVTTIGAPVSQPQTFASTANNGSATLSWTNGSGQRRIVFAKAETDVDILPVDNATYAANTFFGAGQQVGTSNFVVYDGSGSSVTVSNLDKNKRYYFAIFEYNQFGSNNAMYQTVNPARLTLEPTAPLPVNWVSFTGTAINGKVRLDWITAQEVNNSGFEVERSSDGSRFMKIGAVASNSSFAYQFIDVQPLKEAVYYRIKQLDIDGQTSYSKTVRVQGNTNASDIRLLQNPVQNQVKLQSPQHFIGGYLQIINSEGKVLSSQKLSASLQVIDVQALQKGVYYLQVLNKEGMREVVLTFIKN